MSRSYGSKIIRKAKLEGYVTREKVPKPDGQKGNDMMVNRLTAKARALLARLELTCA